MTNNPDREVAYNTMNLRVMDNVIDDDRAIASKRGIISYTTINLPRIGIKNSNNKSDNYESFFNELEEKMDIVKDQLLDRFEKQGNKKVYEFPFLIGEGMPFRNSNEPSLKKPPRILLFLSATI